MESERRGRERMIEHCRYDGGGLRSWLTCPGVLRVLRVFKSGEKQAVGCAPSCVKLGKLEDNILMSTFAISHLKAL